MMFSRGDCAGAKQVQSSRAGVVGCAEVQSRYRGGAEMQKNCGIAEMCTGK